MPNAGWITLDSCITDYLDEAQVSDKKYSRLWHFAFRIMDEMGIDFFYQIQSVRLPVLANKTVSLPNNCLNWTKVGVLSGNGEVYPLRHNTNLTNYADLNPNRLTEVSANGAGSLVTDFYSISSPNFYNFYNSGGVGTLYGVAMNDVYGGGFKVDKANGIILLDANTSFTDIVLEYVASPVEGEEYYIPTLCREAMITGIAYMDIRNLPASSHFNLGDKRDRKQEYYNQKRLAGLRLKPFSLEQAYIQSQDNSRLTVKT